VAIQISVMPLPEVVAVLRASCSELYALNQLLPSLSPKASASTQSTLAGTRQMSSWPGFGWIGQLSLQSRMPSPSVSTSAILDGSIGQSSCSFGVPSPSMSGSQASPIVSLSRSRWSGLATSSQLSHASPSESASASSCPGLATARQLSHSLPTPSVSPSACAGLAICGQLSHTSPFPSESPSAWSGLAVAGQLSHASPLPSPSVSVWVAFAVFGQLSHTSPIPSPSASSWSGLATTGQLSQASHLPSPSLSGGGGSTGASHPGRNCSGESGQTEILTSSIRPLKASPYCPVQSSPIDRHGLYAGASAPSGRIAVVVDATSVQST